MGLHALPVEQGSFGWPVGLGICADALSAPPGAVGDEQHCLFDCPHDDLRSEHAQLFDETHGAMRSHMWHKIQKSVWAMILAIVTEA